MTGKLNVLYLAAEADPYVKIGGLGDVAGSLPLALRALPSTATGGLEVDARLVLPLHASIRANSATLRPVAEFTVFKRGGSLSAQVYQMQREGMPVYFISSDIISAVPSVYSSDPSADRMKYAFFSLAALELCKHLNWRPDVVHANDWHTALACYALRTRRNDDFCSGIRTMLTIHNLPYMGGEAMDALNAFGLQPIQDEMLPEWAWSQPLPMGLWSADAIVPVSPAYAHEILTAQFGCGLENFFKKRAEAITGILNALDYKAWDPATDKAIATTFDADTLDDRHEDKAALQQECDLPVEPRVPLLGTVSRLDPQKGIDLTLQALRGMTDIPWQAVILGTGDPGLEEAARRLQTELPGRVRALTRFDAKLSRRVYAGSDMLLMPSRYEPCGISQMIAMRYGCVPVVHATGGLKNTVEEGKTGFLFEGAQADKLDEALRRAITVYIHPEKWRRFQRNGMAEEFSWMHSARQYFTIYRSLIQKS
jgi:starch synthase